jgi:hypothetical protein
MMPPMIDQIAADASNGWPPEPRWLGNIRRSPIESTPDAEPAATAPRAG